MTKPIPNIELVLPVENINSLAAFFYQRGYPPIDSAVYIASRPFTFDGNASADRYTVRNLDTGQVTVDYPGIMKFIQVHESDVFYTMDNGDVLNISRAMRDIGKGVFERMVTLVRIGGHPN